MSSVELLAGIAVSELPPSFTIAPGASRRLGAPRFTTDERGNQLVGVRRDHLDGRRRGARSGCRSRFVRSVSAAPTTFTATASADSGALNWNAQAGYAGTLDARGFGLVADAPTPGLSVAQDPDQDIGSGTFTDGVYVKDFSLAAGKLYTAALFNSTTRPGADLDMYLFADLNNNGTSPTRASSSRASGGGDSNETIELQRPPALNYRLVVHGWGTAGGDGSTFTLHEWYLPTVAPDPPTLAAQAGSGDPFAVSIGDIVPITSTYAGITGPGTQYRGTVEYYNQANTRIGTTVVILNR